MRVSALFSPRLIAVSSLTILLCPGALEAQVQNPIQAFKDAMNKAKQQAAQKPAQPATQSAAQAPGPGTLQAALGSHPGLQPASGNQVAVPGAFSSSLLTPEPTGGLDPSKLPDLLGVHIGEPTDQVVAEVQKLYPII